eukprot:Amastigsp_a513256_13.p5 type:complete len:127 gc:universal Amastigsp_a513256_13:490-110(-)
MKKNNGRHERRMQRRPLHSHEISSPRVTTPTAETSAKTRSTNVVLPAELKRSSSVSSALHTGSAKRTLPARTHFRSSPTLISASFESATAQPRVHMATTMSATPKIACRAPRNGQIWNEVNEPHHR